MHPAARLHPEAARPSIELAGACTATDVMHGHKTIQPKVFFLFQPNYLLKSSAQVNSREIQYSVGTFHLLVLHVLTFQFVRGLLKNTLVNYYYYYWITEKVLNFNHWV